MGAVAAGTELDVYAAQTATCTRCVLAEGRTQVVFGNGDPDADLMFVGEAPGFHEDKQGFPFVGQAGKLLDQLLAGIDLTRDMVFVANVLKCRPPGNRDPMPDEIEACESHLFRQVELIKPKVVATLGNFSTKLLSGKQLGITRVHGQELIQELAGLPDERHALLVLVEARCLPDEHQVRAGVAVAEDDLRPSLRQSATGAGGSLRRVGV